MDSRHLPERRTDAGRFPHQSDPAGPTGHELQSVRGIVRDELACATLKVDQAEVLAVVARDVQSIVERVYDSLAPKAEAIAALVAAAIETTKAEMLAQGVVKQNPEVVLPSGQTTVIDGKVHAALPRCIRLAAARRHVLWSDRPGRGRPILPSRWRPPWAWTSLISRAPRA